MLALPCHNVSNCFDIVARKLAAGPGNWVTYTDLRRLSLFGFHSDFKCIETISRAAQLRVVHDIFPDIGSLVGSLQDAHCNYFRRPFDQWHYSSFVTMLNNNQTNLKRLGITNARIRADVLQSQRSFQYSAQRLIMHQSCPDQYCHNRIRKKIARWNPRAPAAHVVHIFIDNMWKLSTCCRPAVVSAQFRCIAL